MEETGIEAELQAIIDVAEVIRRENAQVTAHYAIVCFGGRWRSGEACAGDDPAAVCWATPDELEEFAMTEGTLRIIRAARQLIGN
jgi:hypothetical protein